LTHAAAYARAAGSAAGGCGSHAPKIDAMTSAAASDARRAAAVNGVMALVTGRVALTPRIGAG